MENKDPTMNHLLGTSQKPSSSTTKIERRLIEKNRRNQMKILYSQLNSLLPNYNPKEAVPLPDQIDEAINYIKNLEEKVKVAQEKKESLVGITKNKRSRGSCSSSAAAVSKSPQLEVHEMGSSLEVVLTCGMDNQFIFYEIIRILQEQNIDVRSANSTMAGDSMLHVVHAKIPQLYLQFGATKVSEKLKRFVDGSSSDVEMHPQLWDFEMIGTDHIWSL